MNECNIVRDLMPLCADELASKDSVEFIQRHVQGCANCRRTWQRCRSDLPEIQTQTPEQKQKIIKKAIRRERRQVVGKTLLSVLIILAIIGTYIAFMLYMWGFFDPIEVNYPSPDGMTVLEIVEKDFIGNTGDGYMIRFNLSRGSGGINRYYTDWDEIEAYWAGDSLRLFLDLVTMEGQQEMRIVDTSEHHHQGGTWEIPDMTQDLIPLIKEQSGLENVTFTFKAWQEDSETVTLAYETENGLSGTLDYHYPTQTVTNIR